MDDGNIVIYIILLIIVAFFMTAGYFVDESVAVEALQKQGFTDIHFGVAEETIPLNSRL